ncbi:hypothetical protein COCC4DRAFT_147362 [Bipolaris maydis ATCC 48331]|uniref:Uncharacterized protein n=1 Tax=Cochliobolus heterostrophus (strain C4 / ATCC 48331 / race T) TaxID=665024 RepID=N4WML5_COCH4|nr:hypothetical protein COCC4DRAFT_147362 [Bipolaris maydis ATCC 48331]
MHSETQSARTLRTCQDSKHVTCAEGAKKYKHKRSKTYDSGDSPVVSHLTTSPPVKYLTNGERTGSSAEKLPMAVCAIKIKIIECHIQI